MKVLIIVKKLATDSIGESTMHWRTNVIGTLLLTYPWLDSAMAWLMKAAMDVAEFKYKALKIYWNKFIDKLSFYVFEFWDVS